jgi:hypothetical protein
MATLPDHWLELAASHGSTKWVKRLIESYLPQLKDQQISAHEFAQAVDDELRSRGLTTPAQQKNYRSNLCQALKTLDPDHPAIALVSPTTEQYRELNEEQRGRLAHRETKYFTSETAELLVERATQLLQSAEWSEVAAGLAVLIGRRISEILLSEFSLKSPRSLNFTEMAKKADAAGLMIEIPTLAPAKTVLKAIHRLQKALKMEDLKLESRSSKMAKQTVNQRYSDSVATQCQDHFADLVPARTDRENLYSHIFRAVYATIAAHWFCPPAVPEHNFKAEIQGHFTLTQDGKKLPNYSARANYDDYAIGTNDGNRDGRLGIKLGTVPGLHIIDAFRTDLAPGHSAQADKDKKDTQHYTVQEPLPPETSQSEPHATPSIKESPMSTVHTPAKTKQPILYLNDWETIVQLMAQRGITGTPSEVFHALVEIVKAGELEQQRQQIRTMSELTASLSWFTDRIDALENTCHKLEQEKEHLIEQNQHQQATPSTSEELLHLRSENTQLKRDVQELSRLRSKNTQLKRELQQTQSQLQGIQNLLGMGANPGTTAETHPPKPTSTIATATNQASSPEPSSSAKPETAVRRNRTETTDKINQIIDALMAWNTSQDDIDTQLRISIPTIKGLASAIGANYQKVIQEVIEARKSELDEHHSRLLIGSRHNASVHRKDELLQAIARDYLGLDNWQAVNYTG